jgi:hypothetical protein
MNRKGSGLDPVEVLSSNLLGGTDDNHKNISGGGVGGAPVEIRTEHLPDESVDCYRCATLLSSV